MKRDARLRLIEAGERELARAEQLTKELEATTASSLAALAADAAEGLVTAEEAASRRAAATSALTEAREREDGLRRSLPELRERLAQEDEQRRLREVATARHTHRNAEQATTLAAKALARPLREAAAAARELGRHRALTAEAEAALLALLAPTDEPIARADEPPFAEGTAELVGLLTTGPLTPLADAARARAEGSQVSGQNNSEWRLSEGPRCRR